MTTCLVVCGLAIAVTAGLRSTWSPCGLSMLSTITPLAERARGNRYRVTVRWFVAGSVLGGACLGASIAGIAIGVRALHLGSPTTAAVAVATLITAGATDLGFGSLRVPVHHRQVNERWLDKYRPWVYASGFGWQIGTGLATYIMTAAVYSLIVLGSLAGSPTGALAVGVLFGLTRGLCVLLGRRITSPEALQQFHRRFTALGRRSRRAVVGVELAAAAGVLGALWSTAGAIGGAALALAGVAIIRRVAARWPLGSRARTTAPGSPGAGDRSCVDVAA
jgi:MFS family permease